MSDFLSGYKESGRRSLAEESEVKQSRAGRNCKAEIARRSILPEGSEEPVEPVLL